MAERLNPEPGGGEQQKEAGRLVVKNEWFEGRCDAGDVIDGEECIISVMRGSGGHGKRTDCSCGYACVSGLKRGLPTRWELT